MNRASFLTWLSAGVFACTTATNAEPIYPPLCAESCIGVRQDDTMLSLSGFDLLGVTQSHEFVSAIGEASGALTDCFLSGPTATAASALPSVTELASDSSWTGPTASAAGRSGPATEWVHAGSRLPEAQLMDSLRPSLFGNSLSLGSDELSSISTTHDLAISADLVDLGSAALLPDPKGFATRTTTVPPQCEISYLSEVDSTRPMLDIPELIASIDSHFLSHWWSDGSSQQPDVVPSTSAHESGRTSIAMVNASHLPTESMFSLALTVDGLVPMAFMQPTEEKTLSYPVLREPTAMWPFEPPNELPNSPFEADVIVQAAVLGETGRDVVRGMMRYNEGVRFTLGRKDVMR